MNDKLYWYKARIVSVYDGDTVTADIDLGFKHIMEGQKIRLHGIDTPEMRGESLQQARKVRDYVRIRCLGKEVILHTFKDTTGKYGRWLAEIYINGESLNAELLENGMAVAYT